MLSRQVKQTTYYYLSLRLQYCKLFYLTLSYIILESLKSFLKIVILFDIWIRISQILYKKISAKNKIKKSNSNGINIFCFNSTFQFRG